jgi:O-methyltransferase involved in polyketide biosynthesis
MVEDKAIEYVEVDLPDIMTHKTAIINKIKKTPHPNLHLKGGNALNLADLESATKYFDPNKPIAIVNEGLMRYFNFAEKTKYAKNVRLILKRFGGLWITSDVSTVQQLKFENIIFKDNNEEINRITKTNQAQNSFESITKAKEFFEQLGFSVMIRKYSEVRDQLPSPKKLKFSEKEIDTFFKLGAVFVMTPTRPRGYYLT